MPLVEESYDSLPYIDIEPTIEDRTAAKLLLDAACEDNAQPHPLLPPLLTAESTPILDAEFDRVSLKKPMVGIDLSRYEALEQPSEPSGTGIEDIAPWRDALRASYVSHEYLSSRAKHLHSLETHGKEQWLAGNVELTNILTNLEKELAQTKEAIDSIIVERQRSQQTVEGELRILEDSWKKGVSNTLETEVAADELRRRILTAMASRR